MANSFQQFIGLFEAAVAPEAAARGITMSRIDPAKAAELKVAQRREDERALWEAEITGNIEEIRERLQIRNSAFDRNTIQVIDWRPMCLRA